MTLLGPKLSFFQLLYFQAVLENFLRAELQIKKKQQKISVL